MAFSNIRRSHSSEFDSLIFDKKMLVANLRIFFLKKLVIVLNIETDAKINV